LIAFSLELLGLRLYSLFKPHVVTVSESSKRELVSLGFAEKQVSIISNSLGFDSEERSLSRNPDPRPLIVYFGRVKRYKRLDHLILALKKVSRQVEDAKLLIAGKGDKDVYEDLARLAKRQGVASRIEIHGEVNEKQKEGILKRAWVYACASMKEGFGISPLEAEAFGVPVVSYDVPGLRDSVEHAVSGLLVKDGEIEELAAALQRVLTEKELREELSRGAVEQAKKYDWNRSARQFSSLLKELLGSASRL
jgi:glycosyltransferase involved in cell wall biosynthesis